MKFVALLRGINVGGKSPLKMMELKEEFENNGFVNVVTYINSGNVIFESDETSIKILTDKIDTMLSKRFFALRTVIVSQKELEQILSEAPSRWKKDDVRKYVAFIISPSKPKDVVKAVKLKEEIDFLDIGHRVAYMTTLMSGLTKSNFRLLNGTKIYKDMTIRNVTTVQKLVDLMKL